MPAPLSVLTAAAQTGPVAVKSPNGPLEISFATMGRPGQGAGGQLAYRVAFRGQPVLEWSNVGLLLEGAPELGPAVRIESSQPSSHYETWKPVHGEASAVTARICAKQGGAGFSPGALWAGTLVPLARWRTEVRRRLKSAPPGTFPRGRGTSPIRNQYVGKRRRHSSHRADMQLTGWGRPAGLPHPPH
jgi:hypothetical protein